VPLEVLNFSLVLLRRLPGLERPEIPALPGFRVLLARVQAKLAGLELSDHDVLSISQAPEEGLLDKDVVGAKAGTRAGCPRVEVDRPGDLLHHDAVMHSRPILLMLIAVTVFSAACVSLGGNIAPGKCGNNWWKYVYSPKRFVIQESCVTVRGIVIKSRYVPDGDAIVILTLDPEYARFSNQKNDEHYGKDTLELEIVCRHPVFKFFVFRCWTCHNTIPVPRVGDHVEADGIYVLDTHHGHMEVHPVTRLTILRSANHKRL
jgi:hypothetical protein